MKIIKNPVSRKIIFACGVVFVVLGFIGVALPVMPTTPFLIVASWCFLRSSQRAHDWLYGRPYFGDALRNWDKYGAICRGTKVLVVVMMSLSLVSVWWFIMSPALLWGVTFTLMAVAVFIVSRPEGMPGASPSPRGDNGETVHSEKESF